MYSRPRAGDTTPGGDPPPGAQCILGSGRVELIDPIITRYAGENPAGASRPDGEDRERRPQADFFIITCDNPERGPAQVSGKLHFPEIFNLLKARVPRGDLFPGIFGNKIQSMAGPRFLSGIHYYYTDGSSIRFT